jgi:hypothetical protein
MTLTAKKIKAVVFCLIFLIAGYCPVQAEAKSDGEWKFQIAPYAWLAGQKGTAGTLPGLPPSDIDVNFYDDIVGNINFAGMLVGEVRKGRFGLFMDIVYTDIETQDPTPLGVFYTSVNVQTKSWMTSVAGLYRLVEQPNRFLDFIGGVRYWNVDTELTLKGASFPNVFPEQSVSNSEDWFDPLIGLKGLSSLGKSKFFVSGGLAVGGFGAGSDFFGDVLLNLGYQWTKGFSTTIGYRYVDVDYENDDFLYDVVQDGLTLGLSWRF